jgi:hypothetical protein
MGYEADYDGARIGATFFASDGSRLTIPHHFIQNVRMNKGASELNIKYSEYDVKISGKNLDNLHGDILTGRFGNVSLGHAERRNELDKSEVTGIEIKER